MASEIYAVVTKLQQSLRDELRSEQFASLGQLAAGMAHELLNPLTAIKIIVQSAIEKGEAGSVEGRDLEVLYEQTTRQERIIRSLIDYARPPRFEVRSFGIQNVLKEIVELASNRAGSQNIQIELELPDAEVQIKGDMDQLRQVFLNLILNAMDATGVEGKITVTMTEHENSTEYGAFLVIQISDSGCGLPLDLGQRIFEPFVSTKETGMGLGLSICKRIVDMHNGEISADNRPEGGATFSVRIPLVTGLGGKNAKVVGGR